MSTIEAPAAVSTDADSQLTTQQTPEAAAQPLRECVQLAVEKYFAHLDGQQTSDLYNMVLSEVEEPLLATVMRYAEGNQSKAAVILGLSRGTLRKKLEIYGLL